MKTTDLMSNSQKKTTWSLQDNKRSEEQRNLFKATGKTPERRNVLYVLIGLLIVLVFSFLLTQIYEDALETCLTSTFCINSKENVMLYSLYVFFNILIVIFAIIGAYIVGKKLGNRYKI